jgi:hypothetical protein
VSEPLSRPLALNTRESNTYRRPGISYRITPMTTTLKRGSNLRLKFLIDSSSSSKLAGSWI